MKASFYTRELSHRNAPKRFEAQLFAVLFGMRDLCSSYYQNLQCHPVHAHQTKAMAMAAAGAVV